MRCAYHPHQSSFEWLAKLDGPLMAENTLSPNSSDLPHLLVLHHSYTLFSDSKSSSTKLFTASLHLGANGASCSSCAGFSSPFKLHCSHWQPTLLIPTMVSIIYCAFCCYWVCMLAADVTGHASTLSSLLWAYFYRCLSWHLLSHLLVQW